MDHSHHLWTHPADQSHPAGHHGPQRQFEGAHRIRLAGNQHARQAKWHRDIRHPSTTGHAIHKAFSTSTEKTSTSITGKSTKSQQKQGITVRPIDLDQLKLLSREADWVAFSGKELDEADSLAYWKRIQTMRKVMLAAQPRMRRIATRLSLRGVFHMPNFRRFKPKHLLGKKRCAKSDDTSSTAATTMRPGTNSTNTANGTAILTGERLKRQPAEKKGHQL